MKFTFALPIVMIAAILPAAAQPQRQYVSTAEMLLRQALDCEAVAASQIQQLQAQVAALTKERDDLKAAQPKAPTEEAPKQ